MRLRREFDPLEECPIYSRLIVGKNAGAIYSDGYKEEVF
jgi:hypothetical protein